MEGKLKEQFEEIFGAMPQEKKDFLAERMLDQLPLMAHNLPKHVRDQLEEHLTNVVLVGRKELEHSRKELLEAQKLLDKQAKRVALAEKGLVALSKVSEND